MNTFDFAQIIRLLLIITSFGGLCATIKNQVKLHAAVAPFVTACCVMLILMLGGIMNILAPMWYVLFVGGLLGAAYYCFKNRKHFSKEYLLPCAVVFFIIAFALWRFNGEYYVGNDTFSHWGVAAKYLVRWDRFPDKSTNIITFQSYPLGTSCFIYYLTRLSGWSESLSLCAFFLLNTVSFLPVLSVIQRHKALGYSIAALVFFFVLGYGVSINQMQVDTLMPIMTVGAAASICCHREDKRKVLLLAALSSMLLVYVKSSGIFFSAIIAVMAIWIVYINSKSKKQTWFATGILLMCIAIAYAIWNIHVDSAFVSGRETRHAVSLSNYVKEFQGKGFDTILKIARNMIAKVISPRKIYVILLATGASLAAGMYLLMRRNEDDKLWLCNLRNTVIACVAIFIIWYVMLFLMYVFSMPVDTAITLASMSRYERTIHVFVIGIAALFALAYFFRKDIHLRSILKKHRSASALLLASSLMMGIAFVGNDGTKDLVIHQGFSNPKTDFVPSLREEYDFDKESSYIVLVDSTQRSIQYVHYVVKYEYLSDDIMIVCKGNPEWGNNIDPDSYYSFWNITSKSMEYTQVEDVASLLKEKGSEYEYFLILNEDDCYKSAIDTFLQDHPDREKQIAFILPN